jgi:hypothetical protein
MTRIFASVLMLVVFGLFSTVPARAGQPDIPAAKPDIVVVYWASDD